MRLSSCLLRLPVIVTALFIPPCAHPVQPALPPDRPPVHGPVSPWLRLNQRAGLIFSGTVLRVQRVPAQHLRDLETIEISFHVENAIRGVRVGQTFSIREWAGLWTLRPRYRVGERLVLFLYPPSRLGLTSPVADGRGRFSITPAGLVRLTSAQTSWLQSANGSTSDYARDGIPLTEFLRELRGAEEGQP